MKYSVIVPYWNAEKWLKRCCDSLHMLHGTFECLLINDHSTDHSASVVERYAKQDDRFIMLTNERTKGVSGARNTGLDHATGDWITFLDADDEMMPDAPMLMTKAVFDYAEANMIQFNHYRFYKKHQKRAIKYKNAEGQYDIERLPKGWCFVWNKLIRREFIGDTRYLEGLQYGEDEIFMLDLLCKDRRIFCSREITVQRHFDNAESLSHVKRKKEFLEQTRALEDFLMRSDNHDVNAMVCDILSEHWGSTRYKDAFR